MGIPISARPRLSALRPSEGGKPRPSERRGGGIGARPLSRMSVERGAWRRGLGSQLGRTSRPSARARVIAAAGSLRSLEISGNLWAVRSLEISGMRCIRRGGATEFRVAWRGAEGRACGAAGRPGPLWVLLGLWVVRGVRGAPVVRRFLAEKTRILSESVETRAIPKRFWRIYLRTRTVSAAAKRFCLNAPSRGREYRCYPVFQNLEFSGNLWSRVFSVNRASDFVDGLSC